MRNCRRTGKSLVWCVLLGTTTVTTVTTVPTADGRHCNYRVVAMLVVVVNQVGFT